MWGKKFGASCPVTYKIKIEMNYPHFQDINITIFLYQCGSDITNFQ